MNKSWNLIFLIDGWGSKFGGINSLNFDLVNSIGKLGVTQRIYCLTFDLPSEEEFKKCESIGINFIIVKKSDFESCIFIKENLNEISELSNSYWIGHDIKTGYQAKKCRDMFGGKLVIIHHMDYEAYYSATHPSEFVVKKMKEQSILFEQAEHLFGVGPKLYKSLEDKRHGSKGYMKIHNFTPGLAEVIPIDGCPSRVRVITFGRIEDNNDRIKQYMIVLSAYCQILSHRRLPDGSRITLVGLSDNEKISAKERLSQIVSYGESISNRFSNIFALPYTDKRDDVFDELRKSTISCMTSISEGFGLSGFEAIAAGVPLVLTENSGLFEFLKKEQLTSYVSHVEIKGGGDGVNPEDVNNLERTLDNIINNIGEYKNNALRLRQCLIEKGYTWRNAAVTFLQNIEYIEKFDNNDFKYLHNFISTDSFDSLENFSAAYKLYGQSIKIANIFSKNIAENIYKEDSINKVIELWLLKRLRLKKKNDFTISDLLIDSINAVLSKMNNDIARKKYVKELIRKVDSIGSINPMGTPNEDFQYSSSIWISKYAKKIVWNRIRTFLVECNLTKNDRYEIEIYHDKLKQENQYLSFDGLSIMLSTNTPPHIDIKKIFVPLSLVKHSSDISMVKSPSFMDYWNLFIENGKTIILGDPGTGKSTLLKYIINSYKNDESILLIHLKIKDISNQIKDKIGTGFSLIEYVKSNTSISIELFEKMLSIGAVMFLIDGLDEVIGEKVKQELNKQLVSLVQEYNNSYYVCTSRVIGYNNFLGTIGFVKEEIDALSNESINDYIDNWKTVIVDSYQQSSLTYSSRINSLKSEINNDKHIMKLSSNPLLLSIICMLSFHGVSLPNSKSQLYLTIVSTLQDSWIESRGVRNKQYSSYDLSTFFSKVAYQIIDKSYDVRLISEDALRIIFSDFYLEKNRYNKEMIPVNEAFNEFMSYCEMHVGILQQKGEIEGKKVYGFLMHRTFDEFYAAIAFENKLEKGEIELQEFIFSTQWVEVVVLALSYISNQQGSGSERASRIIEKIINTKTKYLEDLDYNIQILILLLSNNVKVRGLTEGIIADNLKKIFSDKNIFKIEQFSKTLEGIFTSDSKDLIWTILEELMDSSDDIVHRNVAILLNRFSKNDCSGYSYVCKKIEYNKEKFDKFLLNVFGNEKLVEYLYTDARVEYTAFFLEHAVRYFNLLTDVNSNIRYQVLLFSTLSNKNFYNIDDEYITYVKETYERIENEELRELYLNTTILLKIINDPKYGYDENLKKLAKKAWPDNRNFDFVPLLNVNKPENQITFIDGRRFYFFKTKSKIDIIITHYDEQFQLTNTSFTLNNPFDKNELFREIVKSGNKNENQTMIGIIEVIKNIDLSNNTKNELFEWAYDHNRIIRNKIWNYEFFSKCCQEEQTFFKFYNKIYTIDVEPTIDIEKMIIISGSEIIRLFYNSIWNNKELNRRELKWMIDEYNRSEVSNKKFALYDIINKSHNPYQ